MDLKAKLEELISQGDTIAAELRNVDQRAGILKRELIGVEANVNLLLQLDPSLKKVLEQREAAAQPAAKARPTTNKPAKEDKTNG